MKKSIFRLESGSTLVEVLVAIGLTAIMLPALAAAIITSNYDHPESNQQLQASGILNQLVAATKSVREASWNNVATDGVYHPAINGTAWSLVSGPITSNGFTESITISDAERDLNSNIVQSGYNDPSTKQIVAEVSWSSPLNSNLSTTFYLTRWQNEAFWTQSSLTDFSSDSLINVFASTSGDGAQVQLDPGQTSGSVESVTFDAGAVVAYNHIWFTNSLPNGTTLRLQIATNNDNSTWNYVGPDGGSQTWYYGAGAIPTAYTNARYFRYKAYFITTNSSTPVLQNVNVDYSK